MVGRARWQVDFHKNRAIDPKYKLRYYNSMNKSEKQLSTLAWTRADYENANEEIPEELLEDDLHTEGELMTREEIDLWIADTHNTLCIMRDHDEKTFEKLYSDYVIDVHYLEELGKITPTEAQELVKKEHFKL